MPAFESRRVRTQPLTVIAASFGASPAKMLRTSNVLLFMIKIITSAGGVFLTFHSQSGITLHRGSHCSDPRDLGPDYVAWLNRAYSFRRPGQ
jgi:Mn2+/Fe2+ NRAMP family transporter